MPSCSFVGDLFCATVFIASFEVQFELLWIVLCLAGVPWRIRQRLNVFLNVCCKFLLLCESCCFIWLEHVDFILLNQSKIQWKILVNESATSINYWPLFTFRVKSYRLGPTKSNLKHKHLTWTHLFESECAIYWTLSTLKLISDRLNWLWLGATKSYLNKHRKSYPQGLWIRPMVGSSNDLHLAPPSLKKTTWTHLESSNICCLLPFWSQLCAWHDWGWQASQL